MNQKTIIAIFGVAVVVLLGTTVYFAIINEAIQPSVSKTIQQLKSTPEVKKQAQSTAQFSGALPTDWKNYENRHFGFSILFPQEWNIMEYEDGVCFGNPETAGPWDPCNWGVDIFDSSDLEKVIAQNGQQFEDRRESRSEVKTIDNVLGTLVSVTTDGHPEWISKTVYFKNKEKSFAISNGARSDDRFERFYKSFKFIN